MKKLASYFLLTLFVFNILGYYPLFVYSQYKIKKSIKHAIKSALPDDELTAFSFTQTEFDNLNWVNSKEFTFNGSMFDFVRKSIEMDGRVKVFAINDEKEKQLFDFLEDKAEDNSDDNKNSKKVQKVSKYFSGSNLHTNEFNYLAFTENAKQPILYQSVLLSFIKEIPHLPPKCVS